MNDTGEGSQPSPGPLSVPTAPPLPMRLHFPSQRTAPDDLLRQLREIDPTIELIYLDAGVWVLGSMGADRRLTEVAQQLIKSTTRWISRVNVRKLRMARAHLQGFRVIEFYTQRDPDSRILADLRERDWRRRHRFEEELEEREAESEGVKEEEEQERAAVARFEARARDAYGYAFRGRRNISTHGLPKPLQLN